MGAITWSDMRMMKMTSSTCAPTYQVYNVMIRQSALACMPRWELLTPRLIRNHGLRSRCLRSHSSSLTLLQNPGLAIGEAMVGQIQIF